MLWEARPKSTRISFLAVKNLQPLLQQRIDLKPDSVSGVDIQTGDIHNGAHHADVPQDTGGFSVDFCIKGLLLEECLYVAEATTDTVPEPEQVVALFCSKAVEIAHTADGNGGLPPCFPGSAIPNGMSLGECAYKLHRCFTPTDFFEPQVSGEGEPTQKGRAKHPGTSPDI